jgi:oligopeptide transport system substrate-binding protein
MKRGIIRKARLHRSTALSAAILSVCLTACNQIQRPTIEPFYANTSPPRVQELRWTNGKSPKSLDPARAVAPPETDLVRATYEGLTELDSQTLDAVPAVATGWESTKDLRTWTFHLRRGAKWSNGEAVTARDFVRSWKRLIELGGSASNSYLFQHIVGMNTWKKEGERPAGEVDFLRTLPSNSALRPASPAPPDLSSSGPELTFVPPPPSPPLASRHSNVGKAITRDTNEQFGVIALDDQTLLVKLSVPDKDFPKLVANPIFRPIFGSGTNFQGEPLDLTAPTNGPFVLTDVGEGSITLEKSDTYWNRDSISLAKIRMTAADTAEAALRAYRRGETDVVTNVIFEPVAVKLLAPYDDFRRMSHNALNFYEINTGRPPFDDRRVRQALSLSIDREKLADGDLQGTTQPAYAFSPLSGRGQNAMHDVKRALELLEKAGYPRGDGFPTLKLVINRNDVQQRIASSVARMWKQNLNINSEVLVKETSEMQNIRDSGDFDLMRRGVVLSSNDEIVNLAAINRRIEIEVDDNLSHGSDVANSSKTIYGDRNAKDASNASADPEKTPEWSNVSDQALYEMTAIPLYFPTSYSLIKPYVRGFEINGLDAPSLARVSLDNEWQAGPSQ